MSGCGKCDVRARDEEKHRTAHNILNIQMNIHSYNAYRTKRQAAREGRESGVTIALLFIMHKKYPGCSAVNNNSHKSK